MSDRVPTRFINTLLRMVGDRGHDVSVILTDVSLGFDPQDLNSPDYQCEISAMQYSRIYQKVLGLLQDDTFGVTGSELVAPGAFRMMCYCVISCETLGQAIERASQFYRTFFGERSQLRANFSQALVGVGYETRLREPQEQAGVADAYGLSVWHRFFGWLCGRPIELKRVNFSGGAPVQPDKYEALFHCPVHFTQIDDFMFFDSSCLAWPVVQTEHSLRDFLRTAPYQLLMMDNDTDGDNHSAQVRAVLGRDFSEGVPSFDRISSILEMSAPTLRRRLKREGTSFQEIKDDVRCDAACLCLSRLELSINDVSLRMGFTDPSAFHRSFKKWMGQTPGQFRAQINGDI